MKIWKRVQQVAITVGLFYGFWLGCNVDATGKESLDAFIIVVLAAVVGISMYTPNEMQGKDM